MKNIKGGILGFALLGLMAMMTSSCDYTLSEVSKDVNKPTQVHPKTILTTLDINTFGIEYYGIEPYRMVWMWDGRGGGGHFNLQRRSFVGEFRRIAWCYDMRREAERVGDERYYYLASFFRAWWMFSVTRLFGDVPYTEAGEGRQDNPNYYPSYDKQEDIIAGILDELAEANEKLALYDATSVDGDIIYGGSIHSWRKLINTLRLRILINCTSVDSIHGKAPKEMFAEIVNDPDSNPLMEKLSDSAIRDEAGNSTNYTYYNNNNFVSSYRISRYVVELMKKRKDTRLMQIAEVMMKYESVPGTDVNDFANYNGVIPNPGATSDNNSVEMNNGSQSKLKKKWYLEPKGPSAMNIGYPEQEFILAEAALRGWISGDAEAYYNAGIAAACEFQGIGAAAIKAYQENADVKLAGTPTQKLGKIITEKYLNFFMQGAYEPYFELRRTGYPDYSEFLKRNIDNLYNDGYLPLRYLYPQTEIDNNNSNVVEAIKRLDKGDDRNSRMWLISGTDPLFNPDPFPFRNMDK